MRDVEKASKNAQVWAMAPSSTLQKETDEPRGAAHAIEHAADDQHPGADHGGEEGWAPRHHRRLQSPQPSPRPPPPNPMTTPRSRVDEESRR